MSASAFPDRGVILHSNFSGYLCDGLQQIAAVECTQQTYERKESKLMLGVTCAGFPSGPSRGSMLKTCSTEATVMKSASFAKWRPGQILDGGH